MTHDIDGAQPDCDECGVVMRDIPGGWQCPSCGAILEQVWAGPLPDSFSGPSIHGG